MDIRLGSTISADKLLPINITDDDVETWGDSLDEQPPVNDNNKPTDAERDPRTEES